jgi:E3 ubiquitin-protein ligase TRIP12
MMTLFFRALSTAAKNSPKIALTLLEGGMACTIYTILMELSPPNDPARLEGEQSGGESGQGVGSGLANMAVMQNLAGRPKGRWKSRWVWFVSLCRCCLEVSVRLRLPWFEAEFFLFLDGVFDPRGYADKSVSRAIKSRMKDAKGRPSTSSAGNTNRTLG